MKFETRNDNANAVGTIVFRGISSCVGVELRRLVKIVLHFNPKGILPARYYFIIRHIFENTGFSSAREKFGYARMPCQSAS